MFLNVLRMQGKRLVRRIEGRGAFTIVLALVAVAFIESCLKFYGAERAELPAASFGWIGNADAMQIQTIRILYFYLIFLLAASVFADAFFLDRKSRMIDIVATRCPIETYVSAMGALAFLGGFLVIAVPLAISQLLSLAAFPVATDPNAFSTVFNSPPTEDAWGLTAQQNVLFPSLYFNHPYLYNALLIAYAALWAGIMALASFAASLFMRKSRLAVIGAPTLAFLVSCFIVPERFMLPYYLYPTIFVEDLSVWFFAFAPVCVLLAAITAIAFALKTKDVTL